ncbi:hypothetical protein ACFO0M_02640 [Micromonospora mangrovi]|uniref:Secreted protein n=2 Tax=Micromonospora TaxID=1873 RepID=A0AAU8H889_9ACTN
MRTGRTVAAVSIAVVGAWIALCAPCAGLWAYLGPVDYFGCGAERPANITATDLVGSYVTQDGGRLELSANGRFKADALNVSDDVESRSPVSGPGTWALQPAGRRPGDITLSYDYSPPGVNGGYGDSLNISGSRGDPWLYWYVGDHDGCDLYRFDRA